MYVLTFKVRRLAYIYGVPIINCWLHVIAQCLSFLSTLIRFPIYSIYFFYTTHCLQHPSGQWTNAPKCAFYFLCVMHILENKLYSLTHNYNYCECIFPLLIIFSWYIWMLKGIELETRSQYKLTVDKKFQQYSIKRQCL